MPDIDTTAVVLRPFDPPDHEACAQVFAGLTPWFGLPETVVDYLCSMRTLSTWVAECADQIVGFLALREHSSDAAEIHVMAVDRLWRGRGIGGLLVRQAEAHCRAQHIAFLQVKTLDSSRRSTAYDETRRFYEALGFAHLETFPMLWDASNPARQLIKRVPPRSADEVVQSLGLRPHPEGGFFAERWRSPRQVDLEGYDGPRNAGTSIVYLLPRGVRSRWHRVVSDELWIWQEGDPVELCVGPDPEVVDARHTLGGPASGAGPEGRLQALVPGGQWQTAIGTTGPHGYALCTCVVVPGFDFRDFTMV